MCSTDLECSNHTYTSVTSEKRIKLNRKDLLKNTSIKGSNTDKLFTNRKEFPVRCLIRLQPLVSTEASNTRYALLTVYLEPENRSRDTIQIPQMNIEVSVYATNKRNESSEIKAIKMEKTSTDEISLSKTTKIAEFSELIDIDDIKEVLKSDEKLKYVIVKVVISTHHV